MDNTLRDATSSSTQLPSDGHTPSTSQSETPMCFDAAWLKAVGLVNLPPAIAGKVLEHARFRLQESVVLKIRQRQTDAEADYANKVWQRLNDAEADDVGKFLKSAHLSLEMAVGIKIRQRLSEGEADELEKLIDGDDQAQVTGWLKVHIPDQEAIVREQFQILTQEVREEFAQLIKRETAPQSE